MPTRPYCKCAYSRFEDHHSDNDYVGIKVEFWPVYGDLYEKGILPPDNNHWSIKVNSILENTLNASTEKDIVLEMPILHSNEFSSEADFREYIVVDDGRHRLTALAQLAMDRKLTDFCIEVCIPKDNENMFRRCYPCL
jgi:hypothetical protein